MCNSVLLIDDDADDRELFYEAITAIDKNIDCLIESNGRLAYNKVELGKMSVPDIIFLDINMAVFNGWQCLRLFKSNNLYQHIPVIMYSTSSYKEDVEKAKFLGAAGFLTKPFNFNLLIERLRFIIEDYKDKRLGSTAQSTFFAVTAD